MMYFRCVFHPLSTSCVCLLFPLLLQPGGKGGDAQLSLRAPSRLLLMVRTIRCATIAGTQDCSLGLSIDRETEGTERTEGR
jgi:hypothetical protein